MDTNELVHLNRWNLSKWPSHRMMTSWLGNAFPDYRPFVRIHTWIPLTKASNACLCSFVVAEPVFEQIIELPMSAITLLWCHCNDISTWAPMRLIRRLYISSGSLVIEAKWRMYVSVTHNDVIKWKHYPRHRPFVQGIHRWPVNSPHKGQWRGV